jgi:hypothetical protein
MQVPNRGTPLAVRPLRDQFLLVVNLTFDYIWYDCPGSRVIKPLVAPFIISRPIGPFARLPERESAIVQQYALPVLVRPLYVIGVGVAHAEMPPNNFHKIRSNQT